MFYFGVVGDFADVWNRIWYSFNLQTQNILAEEKYIDIESEISNKFTFSFRTDCLVYMYALWLERKIILQIIVQKTLRIQQCFKWVIAVHDLPEKKKWPLWWRNHKCEWPRLKENSESHRVFKEG